MGYETWIATPSLKQAIWVGKDLCSPRGDLYEIRQYFLGKLEPLDLHPEDPRPGRIRTWLKKFGREDTRSGGDSSDSHELFLHDAVEDYEEGYSLRYGWVLCDAWTGANSCPYCLGSEQCLSHCTTRWLVTEIDWQTVKQRCLEAKYDGMQRHEGPLLPYPNYALYPPVFVAAMASLGVEVEGRTTEEIAVALFRKFEVRRVSHADLDRLALGSCDESPTGGTHE